jgi:hypothetical protein
MTKRVAYRNAGEVLAERHTDKNGKKSWRDISDELGGMNRGYLSKVARGKARASDHLIAMINEAYGLRLPFNSVTVAPCPICGAVHRKGHPKPRPYDPVVRWARIEPLAMRALRVLHGPSQRRTVTSPQTPE